MGQFHRAKQQPQFVFTRYFSFVYTLSKQTCEKIL